MSTFDVFNGDADGIFARHQWRLAEPASAILVTGVKRDTRLLDRVDAQPGDRVDVFDVAIDDNSAALGALLARGVRVRWFDHHGESPVPAHPGFQPRIDRAAGICTSVLVDRELGGRFRRWAIAAAYGDGLPATAAALAAEAGLEPAASRRLEMLGEAINHNAYGETEADLRIAPAELARRIAPYTTPEDFIAADPIGAELRAGMEADLAQADTLRPWRNMPGTQVYLLPDAPWSRRVQGSLAHRLAIRSGDKALAVVVPRSRGGFLASVRAPAGCGVDAGAFCREFRTGGGRATAGGINQLPPTELEAFVARFEQRFRGDTER